MLLIFIILINIHFVKRHSNTIVLKPTHSFPACTDSWRLDVGHRTIATVLETRLVLSPRTLLIDGHAFTIEIDLILNNYV